jgi:hypothetical protein
MASIGDVSNDELDLEVKRSLHNVLGPVVATGRDFDWIVQAILGSLCMQYVPLFCFLATVSAFKLISLSFFSLRTKSYEAHVRLPLCLVEPEYVSFLGAGYGAIRCLHRISFLARLNSLIEEAIDRVIDGERRSIQHLQHSSMSNASTFRISSLSRPRAR